MVMLVRKNIVKDACSLLDWRCHYDSFLAALIPMKDNQALSLSGSRELRREAGASYPAQVAAHLYFISSGLWLTARWIGRGIPGMGRRDVMTERAGLQRRFSRYLKLLHQWGMLHVEFSGFEDCEQWSHSVIAPNHPSIIDAVALVSRIPGLDCVMNARLLHDPVMGGAARLCGFVCNNAALPMVKACEKRLAAGSNILIFPEGTRTTKPPLGPMHHGYALAAIRSGAAIRTIIIECDSAYFGHSFSFFRPAKCPMWFRLTAGKVFHPAPGDNARELSHQIEQYYRGSLVCEGGGIRWKSP